MANGLIYLLCYSIYGVMKVYIGADHRGYLLKESILYWFEEGIAFDLREETHKWVSGEEGFLWDDVGTKEPKLDDDYTDYAQAVAEKVAADSDARGIVICGSGMGVCMMANKVRGVRCGLGISPEQVKSAREDDDINVLALASDYTADKQAIEMIKAFLATPFSGKERHRRRLEKIRSYEGGN